MTGETAWDSAGAYDDIRYGTTADGIAKLAIDWPDVHNAFRPQASLKVSYALYVAVRMSRSAQSSGAH